MRRPVAELLTELRQAEEHSRLEAKQGFGKSALETVVAFSNEPDLGGGYLLFGVAEDVTAPGGFKVVGVGNPSQLGESITSECSEKLSVPVRPELWREQVEGGCVVVAFVAEAANHDKPIYIKARSLEHGCFRRVGSADVKCRSEDLSEIFARRHGRSAEQAAMAGTSMGDVDLRALAYYRKRLSELRPGSEAAELPDRDLLVRLGALDATGLLTRAGLVLFGTESALRQHLPAVRIDLVQVAGTEWVQSAEEPFVEQLELRQDAVGAFRRAQDWLARTLPKTSHFVAGDPERKDDTTVPARVVREALVNAIIHRDYAVQEAILVVRYRDRIEIRSPGYSLVNSEEWGEASSRTRNPSIAEVFRDLNLAETKGTGIRMMRRRMLEAERRPPLFRSDRKANRFTAVLSLEHLLSDGDRAWLEQVAPDQGDLHARQALLCARDEGRVSNAELRDRTGLDTLAASEVLKRLRVAGLLTQHTDGGRVGTFYVLAGRPLAQQSIGFDEAVTPGADGGQPGAERAGAAAPSHESGPDAGGFRPDAGGSDADAGGLDADAGESDVQPATFSPGLQARLAQLGRKPRSDKLRAAIVALCTERALTPSQLARLLGDRNVKHLVASHLSPMVADGVLVRTRPNPSDPHQAYRAATAVNEGEAHA